MSDSAAARERLADRLREVGLDTGRFIDVQNGEKASVDHEQHEPDGVAGNYGIYARGNDALVILDVDDYGDLDDKSGVSAIQTLPPTFEQKSPHGGTHKLYKVRATDDGRLIAAALADAFDTPKGNLNPSWGEVRAHNQYVVGAGSQLGGCEKEWCDNCATADGGYYSIQADRAIASVSAEELIDVLSDDPDLSTATESADAAEPAAAVELEANADVDELLSFARDRDDKLDCLLRGDYSDYRDSGGVDRSEAECALAMKLAFWLGHGRAGGELKREVRRVMEQANLKKWPERGDGYHESVLSAIDEQTEFFDPSENPDPDPSTIDWDAVEQADTILGAQTASAAPAGELVHENGCYGIRWEYRNDNGDVTASGVDTVCNFTLETLSFLNTEAGTDMVVRVHPDSPLEDAYDVRVDPSVFNGTESFRSEIVTGRTTWFDPSNREQVPNSTILRYLRETVGNQPAPHREGTPHIGLAESHEEFVTPHGSLVGDGWAEDPEYEFYVKGGDGDTDGALPQKWSVDPDDGADYDEATVARICELLPRIRKMERGLPILGWFYAAPLKPFIHEWEDEFPLLAPHGDTGSGKTSGLRPFMKAFGGDGEPFSASDSSFTIEKHLAESRGFPVWFDEYKPSEMADRRLRRLHRRLKEVTKERTLAKGTPDLGEVTLHLRAPVILSGEQKVTDAAVRRRAIITNLSQAATRDGTETKAAFGELTGTAYEDDDGEQHYPSGFNLTEHARAYYQWVLDIGEEELRERWRDAREVVKDILRDFGVTVEESEQRGLQTVAFGVGLHHGFAEAHGVDVDALPDEEDVRDACAHVVENIGKGGHRREHADEFLEVMTLAALEGNLNAGVHHRVLDSQKFGTEVLAVHMPSTYTAVSRFVRDSNVEDEYTILSKGDYLDSFSNKVEEDVSYVLATNERVRKVENGSKAVFFDHEAISEALGSDFQVDAFRPPEERGVDADEVPATPIEDLTQEGNPYTTVSIEVAAWEVGSDGGPAEKGVFRDETGTIDVVDFFGCEASGHFEEGECFIVEDVRVSTYDGALQLEIVRNTTDVMPIQDGVGHTSGDDPGDGQEQLDAEPTADESDDGQQPAAADGGTWHGYDGTAGKVAAYIRENAGPYSAATIAGAIGEDPETVESRLDKFVTDGKLRDNGGEYVR